MESMSRSVAFAPNEYYHLYNRGVEKREVFLCTKDYERFLSLLYMCNSASPVDLKLQGSHLHEILLLTRDKKLLDICAYCLMPNHFHLLVRSHEDSEGGISRFMQKLTTAYTMYFNKKYDRSGSLFQGKFKATHAIDDNYLKYLIAYIHLNPVKLIDSKWKENGIHDRDHAEAFLHQYRYSSFADFAGFNRLENKIISLEALPTYFEKPSDFKANVREWLEYKSD